VIWGLVYAALLTALVVRVRTEPAPVAEPLRPMPGEHVWLVTLHHGLFYALLAGAPFERILRSGAADGRVVGALIFGIGVAGYRTAGRALGEALSPFIEPRVGAPLVTRGPYRCLRHPMYLAQAAIAVGAPLTLGCRWDLVLSGLALGVLAARVALEEEALARTFPEYSRYASRTKRIVPFLY
jgi:protein-S-isoprenylcysteine O-methyltransferase Ste14